MQTRNKFKTARACHCRQCRSNRTYKQIAYRESRRKFRHDGNRAYRQAVNLSDIDRLDDLLTNLIGSVYTD